MYVRNLPSNISASEIEEEFKNFGTIKPDGVFLRTRKVIFFISLFFSFLFFLFFLCDMMYKQSYPTKHAGCYWRLLCFC